jgi:hypothetical protein
MSPLVVFVAHKTEVAVARLREAAAEQGRRYNRRQDLSSAAVNREHARRAPCARPPMLVRFAMQDYGIEQLIGAIKLRVQEQGGKFAPPDAISEAQRVQREAAFLARRDELMSSRQWIEETAQCALRYDDGDPSARKGS